jgi:hypothetical protein
VVSTGAEEGSAGWVEEGSAVALAGSTAASGGVHDRSSVI